ncbi:hypothetical protein AVEN_183624-1 [Araneus ventricosus]|uniref:Uncharacterized protein n=2 Tax=Araneus ventricosus TaxID=182803 RepID=A0A4Y2W8Q6_ARAVE|nr:hypothetical protein AVEN_183624-1 [Araneus ventricosus]
MINWWLVRIIEQGLEPLIRNFQHDLKVPLNRKNKDLKTWRVPPSHDWYKRSSPGGSIGLACDRADQTALSRFVSGHLRNCSISHDDKVFPVCAKCGVASLSPEHILSCLRLSRETFETHPLLALDFLRVSGLMDGV